MSFNLTAITVCVNYPDLLSKSLRRWHIGSDKLIVITSKKDKETQALCRFHNVETHVTDIFYANGAKFNKGSALSECVFAHNLRARSGWMVTFDADIVPPADWRLWIEEARPEPGLLYGAYRYQQPEHVEAPRLDMAARMPQGWVIGFFTMFHLQDANLPARNEPLFDLHWPHAGNYDTAFTNRWQRPQQRILDVPMIHLGEERANWIGRGKAEKLHAEFFSKRAHLEDWRHEQMKRPPKLRPEKH